MNCYLVREDDGLTLVDTTMSSATDAIEEAIRASGLPLKRILLTHGHGDHVGALDPLVERHPGVEVIAGRRELKLLQGDRSPEPGEDPQAKAKGSVPGVKTQPTRLLEAGETVGSLTVHASPGHTPGHLSFLDSRDGTLLTGDAVTTAGRVAVSGDLNWRFPFPAMATWSKLRAAESARRLLELQPARLATGHGPVVEDGTTMLAQAVARFRP